MTSPYVYARLDSGANRLLHNKSESFARFLAYAQAFDGAWHPGRSSCFVSLLDGAEDEVTPIRVCQGADIGEELLLLTVTGTRKFLLVVEGTAFSHPVGDQSLQVFLRDFIERLVDHGG